MSESSQNSTVGELVRNHPARSRVFEQLGIDYCCGGSVPLAIACAERSLDVSSVLEMLAEAERIDDGALVDANSMALAELANHIESTHHAYLKGELPRIAALLEKVSAVHGSREARLLEIRNTFLPFQAELTQHMMKEEQVLFPMIRALDQSDAPLEFHCGSLNNPIRVMEDEHDNAGAALAAFRRLTDDYTAPEWACNTLRATIDALARLETDMHQHVHKENNVLFPKALARERQIATGAIR